MVNELLAVTYGLSAAASWGIGDFSGGFATKKNNVLGVMFGTSILGAVLLFALALWKGEPWPGWVVLVAGAGCGIVGTTGLGFLYHGLASGRMGVVSPVAAVVTAGIPVVFGAFLEGSPPLIRYAGFGAALVSIWLLSAAKGEGAATRREILIGFTAGACFGLYFILVDHATSVIVYWPLLAARMTGFSLICFMIFFLGKGSRPSLNQVPLLALAGFLDVGGNVFFALAAQTGRLDISSVVSSMYPAATVGLAWLLLKEKLTLRQWAGVAAALIALGLIAA